MTRPYTRPVEPRPVHERGNYINPWTEDRIDLLKRSWTEGHSCAEIAAMLQAGLTRNAVIGKVRRLGLVMRNKQPGKVGIRKPRTKRSRVPWAHDDWWPKVTTAAEPQYCSLMELTNESCRWPIGDPGKPGFCFCGRLEADLSRSIPYCAEHTQKAKGHQEKHTPFRNSFVRKAA